MANAVHTKFTLIDDQARDIGRRMAANQTVTEEERALWAKRVSTLADPESFAALKAHASASVTMLTERPESKAGAIEAIRDMLGREIRDAADKGELTKLKHAIAAFEAFNALYPVP